MFLQKEKIPVIVTGTGGEGGEAGDLIVPPGWDYKTGSPFFNRWSGCL